MDLDDGVPLAWDQIEEEESGVLPEWDILISGPNIPGILSSIDACKLCQAVKEARGVALGQRFVAALCTRHAMVNVLAVRHGDTIDLRNGADREDIFAALAAYVKVAPITAIEVSMMPVIAYRTDLIYGLRHVNSGHARVHVSSRPVYGTMPEKLADAIASEAQKAVRWFHPALFPDFDFPAVMTKNELTDAEVDRCIQGFQYAMDREIARILGFDYIQAWPWRWEPDWRSRHQQWINAFNLRHREDFLFRQRINEARVNRYDLSALPRDVQRALVSRWWKLWEPYEGQYDLEAGFQPPAPNSYHVVSKTIRRPFDGYELSLTFLITPLGDG